MTDTAASSTLPQGSDTDARQVKTNAGYAWFSAAHATASLAIADIQAWESQMQNGATATPRLGVTAPQVGAAAGIVGATGVWGNLGVSVANLVMGTLSGNTNNPDKAASLQITVTNNSSSTVVLYKAQPANAEIANVVPPLASGESGVFVIVNGGGFSAVKDNNSKLDLIFRVGGGVDYDGDAVTNSIYVEFNFEYLLQDYEPHVSSPGRWTVTASIDSSDKHAYGIGKNTLQLYGGAFIGNKGSPDFAFYTYSVETGTGQIDIVFYDCAAGGQNAAPVCLLTKPTGGKFKSGKTVTVEAVVVGSMDYLQSATLTVTQLSTGATNKYTPTNSLDSSPLQFSWTTGAGGRYGLSVSATNKNPTNNTGTSDIVYVDVDT